MAATAGAVAVTGAAHVIGVAVSPSFFVSVPKSDWVTPANLLALNPAKKVFPPDSELCLEVGFPVEELKKGTVSKRETREGTADKLENS